MGDGFFLFFIERGLLERASTEMDAGSELINGPGTEGSEVSSIIDYSET